MRGLGRFLALPWLLIALAVQSLAPAEAAAMRSGASAIGVCSAAHELGGSHRPDPAKPHDHDCCAFACAVASLAGAPPTQFAAVPVSFAVPAGFTKPRAAHGLRTSPLDQPRARGPPASPLTI